MTLQQDCHAAKIGGQVVGSAEGSLEPDPLPGTWGNKAQQGQRLLCSAPCLHPSLTWRAQLSPCQLMLPTAASLPGAKWGRGFLWQQDRGPEAPLPHGLSSQQVSQPRRWLGLAEHGSRWLSRWRLHARAD